MLDVTLNLKSLKFGGPKTNLLRLYPNRNKKQKIPEKKHVKLRAEHVRIKHA